MPPPPSQNTKTFPTNKIEILYSIKNDIHFNLATEQYLYEHSNLQHPVLFLWRNEQNIVIGRHQNPWKECFIQNMEKDGIKLSRRKTGGGAVFQDLGMIHQSKKKIEINDNFYLKGNSCFSFLTPVFDNSFPLDSQNANNLILIKSLANLGIHAQLSGRNDIICDGKKISGSAYQVSLGVKGGKGKKALHHGTMLLNLDSSSLERYLNPNKLQLKSQGIDSVKSRVMNLIEKKPDITHEIWAQQMQKEFISFYEGFEVEKRILDDEVLQKNEKINEIYAELQSYEWLYSSTPQFTNNLETRFDWGIIDIFFKVEKNVVVEAQIYSDCLYADFITYANSIFIENKINYNSQGINIFINQLQQNYASNELLLTYSDQMRDWLLKNI